MDTHAVKKGNHKTGKKSRSQQAGTAIRLRTGETVTLDVNRLGINGEGIGYKDRQVVFVEGALPGEKAVVRITQVEPKFARGKLLKIVNKSPERVKPLCPVYEQCGGCSLQHLNYQAQLDWKQELVREAFARYTDLKEPPIQPTIGMDHPFAYRNKAQLPVALAGETVVAGLYAPGSHKLVDTSSCAVQHPTVNEVIQTVRDTLQELAIPIYNEKKHSGVVRTIVPRIGFETGDVQLTLVTRTAELPKKGELIDRLRERLPFLTSIMQNVNPIPTSLVFGDKTILLWGKPELEEQLGNIRFTLAPRAFFQLNPEQTYKLYNLVSDAAALTGTETVVDAYCGVGTIALWLAPHAKEVIGIDIIPEAIENAKDNAKRSGIQNARFATGPAEKVLVDMVKQGFRPDVVVVDPPRSGLDPKLLQAILEAEPQRFVYVSCNPATLAKDSQVLMKKYEIRNIQPIDMFPQTAHVECVCVLTLK